jgi:hypothetical protein
VQSKGGTSYLRGKQLLAHLRVPLKERSDKRLRVIGRVVGLEYRLLQLAIDAGEALLHAAEPITKKITERSVDPPGLVLDVHETDEQDEGRFSFLMTESALALSHA